MRVRTITTIVSILTVAMMVLALLFYVQAERARAEAERLRAQAEAEAQLARANTSRAHAMNDFLVQVLAEAETEGTSPDLQMAELIEKASSRLDEVTLDPDVEARLRATIERVRQQLREPPSDEEDPAGSPPSGAAATSLDQTLAGSWQEVDDAGAAIPGGRTIEVLPSADVMNIHGRPAATFDWEPEKDYGMVRLIFVDEEGSNLLVMDDRMPWVPFSRGRWTLEEGILKLNLLGASASDPRFGQPIMLARQ
jgi:hypothetical protein